VDVETRISFLCKEKIQRHYLLLFWRPFLFGALYFSVCFCWRECGDAHFLSMSKTLSAFVLARFFIWHPLFFGALLLAWMWRRAFPFYVKRKFKDTICFCFGALFHLAPFFFWCVFVGVDVETRISILCKEKIQRHHLLLFLAPFFFPSTFIGIHIDISFSSLYRKMI